MTKATTPVKSTTKKRKKSTLNDVNTAAEAVAAVEAVDVSEAVEAVEAVAAVEEPKPKNKNSSKKPKNKIIAETVSEIIAAVTPSDTDELAQIAHPVEPSQMDKTLLTLTEQLAAVTEQLHSQSTWVTQFVQQYQNEIADLKKTIVHLQNQTSDHNDIDALKDTVKNLQSSDNEFSQQLTDEVNGLKRLIAVSETKAISAINSSAANGIKKEKIVLNGDKDRTFCIEPIEDGLNFARNDETIFLIGKNGQIATGTKAPRSFGKGSAHFRAGSPSEAMIPSAGTGSTRGVIVEGDGDDDKSFVLRAVSKMNRQGFNVFSDGSMALGKFEKINNSTFGVYHRHNNKDAVCVSIPSKDFDQTVINIQCNAPVNKSWKSFSVTADCNEDSKSEVFAVDGTGSVFSNGAVTSNQKGYAEYFEWSDSNSKNENRTGTTVTLDQTGKLRIAEVGDTVVGVVVTAAAFTANSAWNHWNKKALQDQLGNTKMQDCTILEWLETEITELKSYYKSSLSSNFAVPQNAAEIQTDSQGVNFKTQIINNSWDSAIKYNPRSNRSEWALVCVLGTATVRKNNPVDFRWFKLKDINDDFGVYFIR